MVTITNVDYHLGFPAPRVGKHARTAAIRAACMHANACTDTLEYTHTCKKAGGGGWFGRWT